MVKPAITMSFLPLFIFSPRKWWTFQDLQLNCSYFFWHWHYVIHSHFAIWYIFTYTVYGVSLNSDTVSVQISIAQVAQGWKAWSLMYKSVAHCVTRNFEKYCGIVRYMESITVFCEQFHAPFSQFFFFFLQKRKVLWRKQPSSGTESVNWEVWQTCKEKQTVRPTCVTEKNHTWYSHKIFHFSV